MVSGLSAQLNPEFAVVKGKKNDIISTPFQSIGGTPIIVSASTLDYDDVGAIPDPNGGAGDYILEFVPSFNYTGQLDVVVEYYDVGLFPGFPSIRYATIRHEIKESLVEVENEIIANSSNTVVVDVLSNDTNSDGNLQITDFAYVKGGLANITASGELEFTFDPNESMGYVSYIAEDDLGTGDHGLVRFINTSVNPEVEIDVPVNNKESIEYYLLDDDYSLAISPVNGSTISNSGNVFTYTPDSEFTGTDVAVFANAAGDLCSFNFVVVDKELNLSFVKDDYVYTSINDQVSFNVFDNDFRDDFNIVDHSPELTYNGNGDFSYTPGVDESGSNLFYYKVFTGLAFHTAHIFVSIDDFVPHGAESFRFDAIAGNTMVIQHNAPITGYTFSGLTNPLNGVINVLPAGTVVNSSCAPSYVLEEQAIEYLAQPGYVGLDAFEVNYCTPNGNCHVVKIDINVSADDGSCLCLVDCVWPGDFNADGIVNLKDLMTFGREVGQSGLERSSAGTTDWNGYASDDWEYLDQGLTADLKNLDANGDGVVSLDDADAISSNYGRFNKLVSKEVHAISETPVILSTEQTSVDSGEWLFIDISLGSDSFPVNDFYGLAFQFNIDEGLIDETSACIQWADGTWVGYDSPYQEVFEQPEPGKIKIGYTRLTGEPVSGSGPIAVLKFIVEEEIQGLRDEDGVYTMSLDLDDIFTFDQLGRATAMASNTVEVDLNLYGNKNFVLNTKAFPNPVSDLINIESNRGIDLVSVLDVNGQVVDQFKAPNSPSFQYSFSELPDGIYFIQLISGTEQEVHKVSHFGH